MTPPNPLVAAPVDTATPFSGAGLLDSGSQLVSAIESGNWLEGTMAGVGVALDTAATVVDPLGSLIGAGLGWLIDHLEPLKGWFNDFTGDAGEVAAFAQTWGNIQAQLQSSGEELARIVGDVDALAGEAMDAYRRFQAESAEHLSAAASWAGAMSTGLQIASTIVQVVHDLVRDVLSQLVGSIISWAAEAIFTLGLATPVIVGQVTTRVASLSAKVGKTVIDAISSCKSLAKLLDDLTALLRKAGSLFDSVLKGGGPSPRTPGDAPSPRTPGDAPSPRTPGDAPTPGTPRGPFDDMDGTTPWTPEQLDEIRSGGYSMAWFDDVSKGDYYDVESPTLGGPGRPFFVMPAEDGAIVRSVGDAARYTGMSPATERALLNNGDVYAVVFPKGDIPHQLPTAADARGWPHFLEGGYTAVRMGDGPGSGFLLNPTREFVIPGGTPIGPGSHIVRLGDGGALYPVRSFR
jgi:hypothetical protein